MTPDRDRPVVLDVRVVTGTGGGPDKTILNQPRFLASAGYHNVCAYLHPPNDPGFDVLRRRAAGWGAPLVSVPDRGAWDWKVARQLLRVCREHHVSIWHGHDYKSNALGLLLRRFWPMRLVTTVHGWVRHTRRTPLYYRIDRHCLPRYEKVFCVSPDLEQECLALGVPPDRCLLLENAIDVDEFARTRPVEEARRQDGGRPNRPRVGAVGRLSPEKGFDVLLAAAERLFQAGHDFDVVICGEGGDRARLEDLVRRSAHPDRIRLAGHVPDTRPAYEAMDAFVLSSYREGLPNVVLEAMALEVPVVATRIAGIPRLIEDGVNGLLVEPGSAEQLARGMEKLLTDAALRRRLARAGRDTIVRRYNFAARMDRLRAAYDEMLGPRAARPVATGPR